MRLPEWLDSLTTQLVRHGRLPTADAEDLSADIREKVIRVIADIESGNIAAPRNPDAYLKQVVRNIVNDWYRTDRPDKLTANEQAVIAAEFPESVTNRGEVTGFQAVSKRAEMRRSGRGRPFLIRLIHVIDPPYFDVSNSRMAPWEKAVWSAFQDAARSFRVGPAGHGATGRIEQAEATLRSLPLRSAQALRLYLAGARQADLARQLGVSRPAATKLLRRALQQLGWDYARADSERLTLLFCHLVAIVDSQTRLLANMRDEEPLNDQSTITPNPFDAHLDLESLARVRWVDELRRMTAPAHRQTDQLDMAVRISRERGVLHALKSSTALRNWINGIELDHIPEILAFVDDNHFAW